MHDLDVVQLVMQCHAVNVGGWTKPLWDAGAVCRVWREAVQATRRSLEEWSEVRWSVLEISKLLTAAGTSQSCRRSPVFSCGLGCYTWKLMLCANDEFSLDEEGGGLVSNPQIGMYLCMERTEAEEAAAAAGTDVEVATLSSSPTTRSAPARTTQFELQVLDPRAVDKHERRCKNIDIGVLQTWAVKTVDFSADRTSWGHPRFHPLSSLREDGWVGEDDTLRLAVHVRVRNGRRRCEGVVAPSHTLALANPADTYARYGGAWHCDVCSKARADTSPPTPWGSPPTPLGSTPTPWGSTPTPWGSTPTPWGSTPASLRCALHRAGHYPTPRSPRRTMRLSPHW
jgi:hypothetical protein